jgi:hypothetical protein
MPLDEEKSIASENRLVVFEDKHIRHIFHNDEWYFSIKDIIGVLTDSSNPRRYWSDLKIQLAENEGLINCTKKSYS